ncbi:MAG: TIGR00366 family protein [Cloacibacillus sp.]
MSDKESKRIKIPDTYVLLFLIIIVAAAASWFVPAGIFERVKNAAGTMTIVPGTYHHIAQTPVMPFDILVNVEKGLINAASTVFFVFISYAALMVIIASGAIHAGISRMLQMTKDKYRIMIIPIFVFLFAFAGGTYGMFEEALSFTPIFVALAMALGYDAITGMAIVAMGVGLGYSGSFTNPFNVGIAQQFAELPLFSGIGYRFFCWFIMTSISIGIIMQYAAKVKANPKASVVYGIPCGDFSLDESDLSNLKMTGRHKLILLTGLATIVLMVLAVLNWGWYLDELAGLLLGMGILCGFIAGWGPDKIAKTMAAGFKDIAYGALMIGIARGILVTLQAGGIVDTLINAMFIPLSMLPKWLAGVGMLIVQTLINFFIPSGSGQAATTMPIMGPLADLLGISRQVAVLAFQFGDGFSNILWPTAFAAVFCGIANIPYAKWLKWLIPRFCIVFLVQASLIVLAIFIGYK